MSTHTHKLNKQRNNVMKFKETRSFQEMKSHHSMLHDLVGNNVYVVMKLST